jgi:hypothetical protein
MLLPLVQGAEVYGPAGAWCWIRTKFPFWVFFCFYVPLWAVFGFNAWVHMRSEVPSRRGDSSAAVQGGLACALTGCVFSLSFTMRGRHTSCRRRR